jgi:O-antigen ligase
MTEATRTEPRLSAISLVLSASHDPVARILNVDLVTVLIAILLPWSTTGVVIAVGLWIVALVPTLELRPFLRSLSRPICVMPIAFFALALVGTLWSDASWGARLYAVGPTARLLVLPLLFYHFERSPRGEWVFIAFLASCALLMLVSWVVAVDPNLTLKPEAEGRGIFVKNYIDQSQEFALCAVALAYPVVALLRTKRLPLAALLAAVALGFVANMMFVVISRTALVSLPVLLALFAMLHLSRRTFVAALCVAGLFAVLAWNTSATLRATAMKFVYDYQKTSLDNEISGVGSRLEYWQKSLEFFAAAPVIGHGTGSTRGLFEQAAIGQTGALGEVVANPHNQTLNVAVQWGAVGIAVLYAMWWLHLRLFRDEGLAAWIGLLVVVQNVFTSLFNSHLFDFVEGWMYVVGVGVAGGMTLAVRQAGARRSRFGSLSLASVRQAEGGTDSGTGEAALAKRRSTNLLAGFALLAMLLSGAWFFWNARQASQADSAIAGDARSIMAGLEQYRGAHGAYPIVSLPDSLIVDLRNELAKDGYLGAEADGFSAVDKEARYASNGKHYGLLFHVDRTADNPAGLCIVEVGRYASGWWGQPPTCRF